MKVFVSYARRDNDETTLREIERQVKGLFPGCTPYIDDLHHDEHRDRQESVKHAFLESDAFVAVVSPWYRRTRWTKKEYRWAFASEIPIYLLISEKDLTALAA